MVRESTMTELTEALLKDVQFLHKQSRITLGLGGTILVSAITMVWFYAEGQFTLREELRAQQAETRETIIGLQRDILEVRRDLQRSERMLSDRWTRTAMIQWSQLLQATNHGKIDVPIPDGVGSPK